MPTAIETQEFWDFVRERMHILRELHVLKENESIMLVEKTLRHLILKLWSRREELHTDRHHGLVIREQLFAIFMRAIKDGMLNILGSGVRGLLYRTMHNRGRALFVGCAVGTWQTVVDDEARKKMMRGNPWPHLCSFRQEDLFDIGAFDVRRCLTIFKRM